MEKFNLQRDGLAKSDYLAGILATVADSFKDIVPTVAQLKGNDSLEVKLKFEIDEHQHQQQVEDIASAEYFSYLIELAERRNTAKNTEKSEQSNDKVLPFPKSGVNRNSQLNSLQNPEIKQALIRGLTVAR